MKPYPSMPTRMVLVTVNLLPNKIDTIRSFPLIPYVSLPSPDWSESLDSQMRTILFPALLQFGLAQPLGMDDDAVRQIRNFRRP